VTRAEVFRTGTVCEGMCSFTRASPTRPGLQGVLFVAIPAELVVSALLGVN
jgi:hypothetical protein